MFSLLLQAKALMLLIDQRKTKHHTSFLVLTQPQSPALATFPRQKLTEGLVTKGLMACASRQVEDGEKMTSSSHTQEISQPSHQRALPE